eukprot:GFUD01043741.1.p1 GENE.GFUD01043741.1~~GFUD01043741.1.p1  ORF type:complete len:545 (+),score=122.04 GFUD01043741.1:220-1854(+)
MSSWFLMETVYTRLQKKKNYDNLKAKALCSWLLKNCFTHLNLFLKMAFSTKEKLLLLLSASSLLFGTTMLTYRQTIYNNILNSQLVIEEGTAAYNAWVKTPIPVYTKFYFFDMINPDAFHNHEKPILEERGPYTFREDEMKVNLTWQDNGTISYRRMKFWYFEREMSVGPLTDEVTTINVPAVGAAEFVRGDLFMEWGISDMLSTMEAKIFIKKTIGELLFDGYEDLIMDMSKSLKVQDEEEDFYDFEEDSEDESIAPIEKFGWFYQRNGTSWSDGDLSMHTGAEEMSLLGNIASWNNRNRTEAFPGDCGTVRGSSDGLFPPGLASSKDSITIFSTDLCRPLHFTRSGMQEVHGIEVEKFVLAATNFANSSVCPENDCYNNNIPSGVQNLTQCKEKSPVFVSRPHFHLADPFYKEQFQYGIESKEGEHDSTFWIEPKTSIPVKVEMRLQLNIFLRKVEGIDYLFKKIPEVMFPVLWFDSVATMPENMAGPINLLVMLPTIMQACGICPLISSFTIALFVFISIFLDSRQRHNKLHPAQFENILK